MKERTPVLHKNLEDYKLLHESSEHFVLMFQSVLICLAATNAMEEHRCCEISNFKGLPTKFTADSDVLTGSKKLVR